MGEAAADQLQSDRLLGKQTDQGSEPSTASETSHCVRQRTDKRTCYRQCKAMSTHTASLALRPLAPLSGGTPMIRPVEPRNIQHASALPLPLIRTTHSISAFRPLPCMPTPNNEALDFVRRVVAQGERCDKSAFADSTAARGRDDLMSTGARS